MNTGKRVSLTYKQDSERDSWVVHYADKDFRHQHKLLRIHAASSTDGYERMVQLGLPFRSLDSRNIWGGLFKDEERVDHQYVAGKKQAGLRICTSVLC